jgi:very-short-patch-repair endonuclease
VLIDVIVPCQTGRKIDGIRAHRCRVPGPNEATRYEGIPCTTPSRTLVDLAGSVGQKSLRRAVEQAAVLRIFDIDAIDAAMDQGKGRRGMPQLRAIVEPWRAEDSIVPRVRSVLEAVLLSLIVTHGLPRPLCNHKLRVGGREIEVDFLWPEQRLVVESDGYATHGTKAAFERDPRRDQDLLLSGYRVARFTWDQVEREPTKTVTTIAHLLEGP